LHGRGLSDKIAPDHPDDLRMPHLLPDWPLLSAFLIASFVLAVTPGPGVFYIVTRSLLQGRRYGFASVGGVALGNLGNAIGAAIGLAALFAVSSVAFTIVKYAGAAYLVYLGVQALRRPAPAAAPDIARAALWPVFRDGFVVALLNPKTAIFFAAFLPQFMNPAASHALQGVVLGALFVAIAAVTDSVYALAAGAVAPALANRRGIRSLGRYITGAAFIGLGLFTALSGSRSGR
jgi:threonine/homoserine/homoserine lactone efflux protein